MNLFALTLCLIPSLLCFFICRFGHRKYATRAKAKRARELCTRGGTARCCCRTVAIEHRIRIENGAESRETGGRKFKMFLKSTRTAAANNSNNNVHCCHTTSMLNGCNASHNIEPHMFAQRATCVQQWSKRTYVVLEHFY